MISIIINPVSGGANAVRRSRRVRSATSILASLGLEGDVQLTERRGHATPWPLAAVNKVRVVSWHGAETAP
ncbi:MAG: hypothetical protein U0Q11_20320 [Vicinamibacterales bacterium]